MIEVIDPTPEFRVGDRVVIERGDYPWPGPGFSGTVIGLCENNAYAVRVRLDRYITSDWTLYKNDLRRLDVVDALASIEREDHETECKHEDLDRVGTEEIVCFDCKRICNFVEAAATGVMVWRLAEEAPPITS